VFPLYKENRESQRFNRRKDVDVMHIYICEVGTRE
jgi:hypothetical protein